MGLGDCDLGYPRALTEKLAIRLEKKMKKDENGRMVVCVTEVDVELLREHGHVVCFNCVIAFLLGCNTCVEYISAGEFGRLLAGYLTK